MALKVRGGVLVHLCSRDFCHQPTLQLGLLVQQPGCGLLKDHRQEGIQPGFITHIMKEGY
jgi:hypothetical protein